MADSESAKKSNEDKPHKLNRGSKTKHHHNANPFSGREVSESLSPKPDEYYSKLAHRPKPSPERPAASYRKYLSNDEIFPG